MKGDANIGSIKTFLLEDLHLTGIDNIVRRYIIDAMTFHRNKRFFFSDRVHQFTLTSGRRDYRPGDGYGLPKDLVEIASRTIWILLNGSDDQREPCQRVSTTLFEESQLAWGSSKDQPDSWDFRGGVLRFSPTPNRSTDIAELRYLTNIGIPRITYESGVYAYYHPTTGEEISALLLDQWVNDWTLAESGQLAIRMRAKYMLQKGYLGDREAAAETLADWLEAVGQLEDETESKQAGVQYLEGSLGI